MGRHVNPGGSMTFARIRAAATAVTAICFVALAAPAWSSMTVTNGILRITIENNLADDFFGEFDVSTGPTHPKPNETVLYPSGTSYITLRDVGALTMWVNSGDPSSAGLAGYSLQPLNNSKAASTAFAPLGTNGFRATWTMANFTIQQDVVIVGTTLADTRVDHTVRITNTSAAARQYGLRYMWDWEIADNDGSFFRTRSPDGAFSANPAAYAPPGFQFYEEVDSIATPTFSIFGSVVNAFPTPEIVRYSDWPTTDDFAWGYVDPPGATSDSSVTYFWGFAAPLTLAAGATSTFVESISTVQTAIGGPAAASAPVPAMDGAMLALLALLLAAGAYVARRGVRRD